MQLSQGVQTTARRNRVRGIHAGEGSAGEGLCSSSENKFEVWSRV